jgi:alpha-L-fucosidase
MKYFVVTTKHHEGFCLWDSKLTDFKAPNTPAKRDLLRPMMDAFRNRDMRVGLYHSLLDWHHKDYVLDSHFGPYRRHADREKMNADRVQSRYADYLLGQTRELLTDFGKIDVLWYDFSYPKPHGSGKGKEAWQSERLYKSIRELQPQIILDDRLDLPYGWDFKTPEQFQPRAWPLVNGKPVIWEACHTFSGSWGYHRDEATWKSVDLLLRMLIDSVSKGGNFLLNVGPTGRGEFDERVLSRLSAIAQWMRRHSRSIYGCTQAPDGFVTPDDCRLTYNPSTNRLYLHAFAWPYRHIHLAGLADRVEYAQLLNDASEIKRIRHDTKVDHGDWREGNPVDLLTLESPANRPNVEVPVIEIFLK